MFPKVDPNKIDQPSHINYLGKSISLSRKMKNTETAIGFIQKDASGQSQVVASLGNIQEVSGRSQMIVVTSSVGL